MTIGAKFRSFVIAGLGVAATTFGVSLSPVTAETAAPMTASASSATPADYMAYRTTRRYAGTKRYNRRYGARTAIPAGGAYFVDFRARYALSYGHTYVAYGRLNSAGQIVESHVAGLHPAGDSSAPWMIGHLVFVPSETGPSDGDLEEKYIAASYRVTMDQARYNEMVSYIRQQQTNSPLWHAVFYNCNTFAGNIARHIGLQAPAVTLVYPAVYINAMRDMNNGRTSASAYSSLAQ